MRASLENAATLWYLEQMEQSAIKSLARYSGVLHRGTQLGLLHGEIQRPGRFVRIPEIYMIMI